MSLDLVEDDVPQLGVDALDELHTDSGEFMVPLALRHIESILAHPDRIQQVAFELGLALPPFRRGGLHQREFELGVRIWGHGGRAKESSPWKWWWRHITP